MAVVNNWWLDAKKVTFQFSPLKPSCKTRHIKIAESLSELFLCIFLPAKNFLFSFHFPFNTKQLSDMSYFISFLTIWECCARKCSIITSSLKEKIWCMHRTLYRTDLIVYIIVWSCTLCVTCNLFSFKKVIHFTQEEIYTHFISFHLLGFFILL